MGIKIKNFSKYFGEKKAVDDVSFTVNASFFCRHVTSIYYYLIY